MTPTFTKQYIEQYLPHSLRRVGREHRTWIEQSASRAHLTINLEKGVYFDFHTNKGGKLDTLLRQHGAPIPKGTVMGDSEKEYRFQLSILARFTSEGRKFRCGKRTAIKVKLDTGQPMMVARVLCLRWSCPKCATFLKRVWFERVSDCHFGAVYSILKGYAAVGRKLDLVKRRARRAGGEFEWFLLQTNEEQLLFVDSRSHSLVRQLLAAEPYIQLQSLMPLWKERDYLIDKGLSRTDMDRGKKKVRHSAGLLNVSGDHVNNTLCVNRTSSPSAKEDEDKAPAQSSGGIHRGHQWVVVDKAIEEVAESLCSEGCTIQWYQGGNLGQVIPGPGYPRALRDPGGGLTVPNLGICTPIE